GRADGRSPSSRHRRRHTRARAADPACRSAHVSAASGCRTSGVAAPRRWADRCGCPRSCAATCPPAARAGAAAAACLPDVVWRDGQGHAPAAAAAAHQLGALEDDRRLLVVLDVGLARQELDRIDDTIARLALELAVRVLVARVAEDHAGPYRDEVAAARPLLALLERTARAAAHDRLER